MRYHKFDLVISLNRLSDIRKRRFIVKRHPIDFIPANSAADWTTWEDWGSGGRGGGGGVCVCGGGG